MKKLKALAIAILLATMDFAFTCFPGLSQILLKDRIESDEPDFYR